MRNQVKAKKAEREGGHGRSTVMASFLLPSRCRSRRSTLPGLISLHLPIFFSLYELILFPIWCAFVNLLAVEIGKNDNFALWSLYKGEENLNENNFHWIMVTTWGDEIKCINEIPNLNQWTLNLILLLNVIHINTLSNK